jgi:hypothetical protein
MGPLRTIQNNAPRPATDAGIACDTVFRPVELRNQLNNDRRAGVATVVAVVAYSALLTAGNCRRTIGAATVMGGPGWVVLLLFLRHVQRFVAGGLERDKLIDRW